LHHAEKGEQKLKFPNILVCSVLLLAIECGPALARELPDSLNGAWILDGDSCELGLAALDKETGFIEDKAGGTIIYINNNTLFGLENACEVVAVKDSKGGILATTQCFFEGETEKRFIRYSPKDPDVLQINSGPIYRRCPE
jgi:hypothetical protein